MSRRRNAAVGDLLTGTAPAEGTIEPLAESALLLRRFAAPEAAALVAGIAQIAAAAPFRHMVTPGGYRMSVAMANCGALGWISDRRGYRYDAIDPMTGRAWPPMPPPFQSLAARAAAAAGFDGFEPDVCLVNRYEPGARLSLHQDKDEHDATAPIVSVSLGLPAVFLWGGLSRGDRPRRILLDSGDVVVWGGAHRFVFHGVEPLDDGETPLTGRCRLNLTFRKAR
jgi:alkylated DNA repair protein (DNA oxidative demethylase)